MEKKIRSVKLKKDLPGAFAGEVRRGDLEAYAFGKIGCLGSELSSYPDFFEIEYEPERKFIDVRIEYNPINLLYINTVHINKYDVEKAIRKDLNPEFDFKVTELKN